MNNDQNQGDKCAAAAGDDWAQVEDDFGESEWPGDGGQGQTAAAAGKTKTAGKAVKRANSGSKNTKQAAKAKGAGKGVQFEKVAKAKNAAAPPGLEDADNTAKKVRETTTSDAFAPTLD